MKHVFLSLVLSLVCTLSYGQKVFYFYNYSPYDVEIGSIVTMPSDTLETYPFCVSKHSSVILVPAGTGIYVLENSGSDYRFPFESPNSSPYISEWDRTTSVSTTTTVSSAVAWVLGPDQVFDYVKFQVGTSGSLGGGNLGPDFGSGEDEIVSPNGWTAEYIWVDSGTYQEYTCVIY